ncbi:hypothetical protein GOBAR_DD14518 [Gossypium barbadense]|nr:hypothetical protein GOBAR_DD14518 [Gossypium barbadense]
MEELRSAVEEHMELMADLVQKLSSELRSGLRPAYDNFMGFFHAIDWKVRFLSIIFSLVSLHFGTWQLHMLGVYFAELLNGFLGDNWKKFANQNYFDPSGLFLSVLWSGPLLIIAIIILINTLFSMCYLIVRWKKAELRHRARLARNKQD